MATAPKGSAIHQIYHERMKSNPRSFVTSLSEARQRMIEDSNVLYFGSSVTFLPNPEIVRMDNSNKAPAKAFIDI